MAVNSENQLNKKASRQLGKLTRQELRELEEKEKTRGQVVLDWFIMILPVICGIAAILEYRLIPDGSPNNKPNTYLGVILFFICAYLIYFIVACK